MPYGFKPVRSLYTRGPCVNLYRDYSIATGYATGIGKGAQVQITTDATVIIGAVGTNMCGVFAGVQYRDTARQNQQTYSHQWPASLSATQIIASIYDDPYLIFMAESDQDTTALVADDVGENADFIQTSAVNTTTGMDRQSIDSSTNATGADIGWHIVGSAEEGEAFTAAGTVMDVYVMPNEHMLKATVAGI